VLAGDNTGQPRLMYLAQDVRVSPGDRVVTSGHGGTMPPGLPVGVVASVGDRGVLVRPYADWGRMEFVRVLDYGLVTTVLPAPPPPAPLKAVKRP
jgi:rod shape-determining protein MreC